MPLFSNPDALDREYQSLASTDWQPAIEAREYLEELWQSAQPYLDSNFREKAAREFRSHFWELYLAAALLDHGHALVPRASRGGRDAGADLLLVDGTAIEAVRAKAGIGSDAVTEPPLGEASSVPDDEIRLRLLNALDEKRRKLDRYCSIGMHPLDKPFVVAINASAVPSARHEQELPRIVRALFPFGPYQVHLNAETLEVIGGSYTYQSAVTKRSGAPVAIDGFLGSKTLQGVSAVLYSCVDPLNRPPRLGGDFIVVHNPHARAPIALGTLPAWREYVLEADAVRIVAGSTAR